MNVISEQAKLALRTTSPEFKNETITLLKTIFENSSYPSEVYEDVMDKQLGKLNENGVKETSRKSLRYVTCPYYLPFTKRIEDISNKNGSIEIGHRPIVTNKNHVFSKIKDKRRYNSMINARFGISCLHCDFQSIIYADQLDIERTFLHHMNSDHSLIKKHLSEFPSHVIDPKPKFVKTFSSTNILRLSRLVDQKY